jgi:hypothetical protein
VRQLHLLVRERGAGCLLVDHEVGAERGWPHPPEFATRPSTGLEEPGAVVELVDREPVPWSLVQLDHPGVAPEPGDVGLTAGPGDQRDAGPERSRPESEAG